MPAVELSFGPSLPVDELAFIEVHHRESRIKNLLSQSQTIPELLGKAGFGSQRRAKVEVFNHGSINVVAQIKVAPLYEELPVVKGTYGLDIPLAVAVISRADVEELELTLLTLADADGLRSIPETSFRPTAKNYETLNAEGVVIMINEAVGAVNQTNWGSAEVNSQAWSVNGKAEVLLTLNPYTALNYDRFKSFWERRRELLAGHYQGEEMQAVSFSLAAGYVAALTQVWLLTGKVPEKFAVNSGDGVYDASLVNPEDDFSGAAPIRLITLRGGLSKKRLNCLKDFRAWLADLRTGTINYADQDKDRRLIREKEYPWVTEEIFQAGYQTALDKLEFNGRAHGRAKVGQF